MSKRFLMVLVAFLTIGVQAFAQTAVSGKVVDPQGEAIVGAGVQVKGTTNGTVTDLDGAFKLAGVNSNTVLVVSSIGYKTVEVTVGNQKTVNVVLAEDAELLDDVVVIGYGTARRKGLTGSITAVDGNAISVQAQGTVTRALEGQVAGLQVSSLDGQPGLDAGIRVRGLGTTNPNNANALVIIDGAPAMDGTNVLASLNSNDIESITVLKDAASTAMYGSRGANGVILVTTKSGKEGKTKISFEGRWGVNTIGANSKFSKIGDGGAHEVYENMWLAIYNSVYYGRGFDASKDAGLAALKGDEKAAAEFASAHLFNYNGSSTVFETNGLGNRLVYKVPGMNLTQTYTTKLNEKTGAYDPVPSSYSSTLSGAYLVGTDGKINPAAEIQPWAYDKLGYDELISNRFRQEYVVSASGASDKIDYHISLGMLSDPSYITWSSFDRYTGRANVNAQITDWLKAGAKFSYAYRETNSQATRWGRNPGYVAQNVFRYVDNDTVLNQLYYRDENGNFAYYADGKPYVAGSLDAEAYKGLKNSYSPIGPTVGYSYNIPLLFEQAHDTQIYSDLVAQGYIRASFLKHFTAEANISVDKTWGQRTRFYNTESAGRFMGASLGSAMWRSKDEYSTINLQQLVNYNQDFGKHHVDAMVGHEYFQYDYSQFRSGGAYSLIPDFEGFVNFLGTATYSTFGSTVGGNINKYAMESYLGRANYVYDDKYYVSASIRRDGSSKFKKPENRWGTFWSVGAGWRISSEEFMAGAKNWLDNLKIRASYGVIGNQNGLGMYSGYQTWSYGAASWAGSGTSTYPSAISITKGAWVSDNLTWENTNTLDAGIDFTLFGGKLAGSFDWYNRETVNAAFNQNVSYLAAGQTSITTNSAGLRNRGIEIELSYQPVKTQDWDVIISTNGTHYNTVLTKAPKGAGSEALNGCWTASAESWTAAGGGSSSGNEILRGIGKDYYNMYLYKYGGVAGNPDKTYWGTDGKEYVGYTKGNPDNGMPLYWHKVTAAEAKAGTFGSAAEGDDILTTKSGIATRYEVGDALPDWIGGLTANVRYKSFDLSVLFSYQIGGKFLSVDYASAENGKYMSGVNTADGVALSRELLGNTWTDANPSAKFPMLYYGGAAVNFGANLTSWNYTDMASFSASYLSIKNITLGYTLPKNLTNKVKISNLRVYASCDNPVLLYSHSGVDPRWSMTGGMTVGAYSYPYLSVYTFGVNIDF